MKLIYKALIIAIYFMPLPADAQTAGRHTAKFQQVAPATEHDPLEPFNRKVFSFNMLVDGVLLEPLARTYETFTPQPVQNGLRNILENIREPRTFLNYLLQGKIIPAADTLTRFIVNSTFGLGGLRDVAGAHGVVTDDQDFNNTLTAWGVGHGPYLVLPILGPSDIRDTAGRGVDGMILDPFDYTMDELGADTAIYIQRGVNVIDKRAQAIPVIDDLRANTLDLYASVRSLYFQHRQREENEVHGISNRSGTASSDEAFDIFLDGEEKPVSAR